MASEPLAMSPGGINSPRETETIQEIFFLGLVVNYFLWGIQITQSYYYYKSFRKTDNASMKAAVGLLFVTEAVQSICTSQSAWGYMVKGQGDLPWTEQTPGWGGNTVQFIDAFTASIVHVFYAQKIWTLLNPPYNYIWTVIVLSFSCLQLTAGTGCTIFMFAINITFPELGRIKTWACIWLVTAAVTDIIITAVMTWKLSKSRTGYGKTDDIVSKLIRLIVETGMATAIVQLVHIMVYLIWPLKSYHVVAAFTDPKVYSNSMLALLNSRRPRKASGLWDSNQDPPFSSIHIRTSQTVDVSTNYELDDHPALDVDTNSSHFTQKEDV